MRALRTVGVAALLASGAAAAADMPPQFGRYMPLYPGFYATAAFSQDERDRSFDQNGNEQPTALPVLGGETRLPQRRADLNLVWHFPLFQSRGWPVISDMPFTARATLGHVRNQDEGRLAAFAADSGDDAVTDADDLSDAGSGVSDLRFEFGAFLAGHPATASAPPSRFSLLFLGGLTLPLGAYNRDAPVNSGENTVGYRLRLGANFRPWAGGFIDAGLAQYSYAKNQDPAFGALEPAHRGDERLWDLSLGQKIFSGLYLTAFATDRKGDPNQYDNPRFSPQPPSAPGGFPPSDNFPTPGAYRDGGTALRAYGLSLSYFVTQRWLAALHYTRPQSGRSGEFDLPYTDRQPAGCTVGSLGCQTSAGGSTHVDGLGESRAYASDRLTLTITRNFGQGDTYTCPGCEQ